MYDYSSLLRNDSVISHSLFLLSSIMFWGDTSFDTSCLNWVPWTMLELLYCCPPVPAMLGEEPMIDCLLNWPDTFEITGDIIGWLFWYGLWPKPKWFINKMNANKNIVHNFVLWIYHIKIGLLLTSIFTNAKTGHDLHGLHTTHHAGYVTLFIDQLVEFVYLWYLLLW